jgi:hypothetical protein
MNAMNNAVTLLEILYNWGTFTGVFFPDRVGGRSKNTISVISQIGD